MNISRAAYETDPGIVLMCSMVRSLGWMCLQKCDISPINICALINAGNLNEKPTHSICSVYIKQAYHAFQVSLMTRIISKPVLEQTDISCIGPSASETLDSGRPVHWPPEYNENCWLKSNISGQALIPNMLTKWTLHFCINRATYLALSQSIPPPKK